MAKKPFQPTPKVGGCQRDPDPLMQNHHQDHQNRHRDHQNHHQDHKKHNQDHHHYNQDHLGVVLVVFLVVPVVFLVVLVGSLHAFVRVHAKGYDNASMRATKEARQRVQHGSDNIGDRESDDGALRWYSIV